MNTRELRSELAAGKAVLFPLRNRAVFRLGGADRVRYLNGQVSNDIRKLAAGEARSACVMTAKGKMNAFVWVAAEPETLRVDTEGVLRDDLAARLERYIIADDVTLSDVTDEVGLAHLLAEGESPEALAERCRALEGGSELRIDRSRRFRREGLDLCGPGAAVDAFIAAWEKAGGLVADAETEEVFRIEQGIPRWGAELNENTIPVEAGLEELAIDYHKGCYIGQEVISRIRSIGHVNRHLRGFVSPEALPAGTVLKAGGKDAGIITSSAWSFALEKYVALGYLKRGTDPAQLEGASLEVRSLPII